MRIAIVQFPGSNCERETIMAVKRAGMEPHEFLWNEDPARLADFAGFVIVGGFSYEDRGRAGILAALDPIMQAIKMQSQLGKPVLGICNGAQILVETGLVPGIEHDKVGMALTDNKRIQGGKILGTGFYNAWVNMRLSDTYQLNAFTQLLTPKNILNIPVAHGEGRFIIPPGLLKEMKGQGLHVFQYCDEHGNIRDEFPVNPNGSIENIAAVSNKSGNVMAMMPHPERTPNGDLIFLSMRQYIEKGYVQRVAPLHYYPRRSPILKYQLPLNHDELRIDLIITDNQAVSVGNALQHIGIPGKISRTTHWEIACDSPAVLDAIKASGVLYNDRKEQISTKQGKAILVRAFDDMLGLQKKQMLEDHFNITGIQSIRHGVLWHVDEEVMEDVIASPLLFNPCAHDCFYYE